VANEKEAKVGKKIRWIAVALLILLPGCGPAPQPSPPSSQSARIASTSKGEQPPEARQTVKPGAISRGQLVADARQLADILESSHPDPYINGGGRIAFHRRLHQVLNSIPEEGMTRDEFFRILRPFIAGVGDAHTGFLQGYEVNQQRPGGIPLRFAVVEESLVVTGVAQQAQRELLGARLVSVEGIPLAELIHRQKQLRGIDNQYHGLREIAEQSLGFRPYMQDLIPEWKDTRRVHLELKRPDGSLAAIELAQPATQHYWITPKSRVELPVPDASGFLYAFLKPPASQKEIAYLRFTHMVGYRETREGRDPILTKLIRPPSATDTFRSMVVEMKKRGTETLLIDVRGNNGGDSLIVDILIYFLYGKETLLKMQGFGTGESGVFRYSHLYFIDRPKQSLEAINADRMVPLIEGDYEFSWSYVDGEPIAMRRKPPEEPPGFQYLRASPTFLPEFESGTYGGYYQPKRVIVLCDAGTASAGFSVVVGFHRLGATLVGTPSGQAPNSFGAAAVWKLNYTGIRGLVPMIAATHFPYNLEKAHVLPVDIPLTYERLASYNFDPNSEYLLALERQ
jgi:hypothetical protein